MENEELVIAQHISQIDVIGNIKVECQMHDKM